MARLEVAQSGQHDGAGKGCGHIDTQRGARLKPFHTVVSCTGFVAGPGTQLKITRAVLGAGVRRYVPWQFGVDYDIVGQGSGQPVFDEQYAVRALLRAQTTTEWVIVSTGMFTSFLFEPAFGLVDLDAGLVRGLGSWSTQVSVTAPEDIGKLTTAILLETPRIANRVVYVAGDTVSLAWRAIAWPSAVAMACGGTRPRPTMRSAASPPPTSRPGWRRTSTERAA